MMSKTGGEYPHGGCPKCGGSVIKDHHEGAIICQKCGYVIGREQLDMSPEWRAFNQKQYDDRCRGGPPMTYTIHDKWLSTLIDWKNVDAHGKRLTPKRRSQMYRLRKWQQRIRVSSPAERNLAIALSEINRMTSQLGLPRNIGEEASVIYRRAVEERLIRDRSIEGVTAAALYAACRELGVPRTLEEITEASRVDKKEIGRNYRFLARELGIHLPPVDPINYVARFGSELDVSGETRTKAIELLKKAKEKHLTSGRNPITYAAVAIYVASLMAGEYRTQKSVADVAHVTEVTIRNRYKELVARLGLSIDPSVIRGGRKTGEE